MRFIDLFAGLGSFHLALSRLGHKCVFACEIDPALQSLYKKNFGILPQGDIRKIDIPGLPKHDILCAGFPCQPFSKAGEQEGFSCTKSGDLFKYVVKILRKHEPPFLLLENVPNLKYHDKGKTWRVLINSLKSLGYDVKEEILSPHNYGIPQARDRVFIVGSKHGLQDFQWPKEKKVAYRTFLDILDQNPPEAQEISGNKLDCLRTWQKFIRGFPKGGDFPSFPVWSMEFGATYPFEEQSPHALGARRLAKYKGVFGFPLKSLKPSERLLALPSYAQVEDEEFPEWKKNFIRRNRLLYKTHKNWLKKWLPQIQRFAPSLQKLEWNCKGGERNIWDYIIQFRASGVRVRRPLASPSLVALNTTQVPVIAWEKRYMTPAECSRLQSLSGLKKLPTSNSAAFGALGNAVNSRLVKLIAKQLLQSAPSRESRKRYG